MAPLTDFDRLGPWTGNALHTKQPPRRPYPHALLVLVMVSVAVGGLVLAALWWGSR